MQFIFTSVRNILFHAKTTFLRFPLVITCGLACAFLAVLLVDIIQVTNPSYKDNLTHLCATLLLGLPLFFAIRTLYERPDRTVNIHPWITYGLSISLLVLVYVVFEKNTSQARMIRFFQLSFLFHLLASFSPFVGKKEPNGFWQYNRNLFVQFIFTALYSGVLYLGLAIALISLDVLFNVKLESDIFSKLWFCVMLIFHPWHFLSYVPKNIAKLEQDKTHPKGLRIFTQYLLIPLLSLYILILYAYMLKISIQWNLPHGFIGWMVSALCVLGILNLLLLYPYAKTVQNKWIQTHNRFYNILALPLICMLLVGIGRRISDYGFTVPRYILLAIALWLLGISLYLIFSKVKNIKVIPLSLFVCTFFTCFGPWGAFKVSERNQIKRIHKLMEKNKLSPKDMAKDNAKSLSSRDRDQLNSISGYLSKIHGSTSIQKIFGPNIATRYHQGENSLTIGSHPNMFEEVRSPQNILFRSCANKQCNFFNIALFKQFNKLAAISAESTQSDKSHFFKENLRYHFVINKSNLLLLLDDNKKEHLSIDMNDVFDREDEFKAGYAVHYMSTMALDSAKKTMEKDSYKRPFVYETTFQGKKARIIVYYIDASILESKKEINDLSFFFAFY